MSDGTISIKLANTATMQEVQTAVNSDNRQPQGVISNDGFFPDIDLAALRQQTRLDGTVTAIRLQDSVIEAIATVNDELSQFKQTQIELGAERLENAPSTVINGESVLIYRYRRAVHCLALANVYERYASYDTTNDGEKKLELLQDSINQLRRDARFAISDIKKTHRINVELI